MWDVSRVKLMHHMFADAKSFKGDISKWDVSQVKDMSSMFSNATSFNADISKWDVSRVTDMGQMFAGATQFKHKLNGAAWVNSKASKEDMFVGSYGSIALEVCESAACAPRSKEELQSAVDSCLKVSPEGDCSRTEHGPIGGWDVSQVTSLNQIFMGAYSFNADISKWDMYSVTDTSAIFYGARSFNGNISTWDVSKVTDMGRMFSYAAAFDGDISRLGRVESAQHVCHVPRRYILQMRHFEVGRVEGDYHGLHVHDGNIV